MSSCLTLPFSSGFVSITITIALQSQIICQKSEIVFLVGPTYIRILLYKYDSEKKWSLKLDKYCHCNFHHIYVRIYSIIIPIFITYVCVYKTGKGQFGSLV